MSLAIGLVCWWVEIVSVALQKETVVWYYTSSSVRIAGYHDFSAWKGLGIGACGQ